MNNESLAEGERTPLPYTARRIWRRDRRRELCKALLLLVSGVQSHAPLYERRYAARSFRSEPRKLLPGKPNGLTVLLSYNVKVIIRQEELFSRALQHHDPAVPYPSQVDCTTTELQYYSKLEWRHKMEDPSEFRQWKQQDLTRGNEG